MKVLNRRRKSKGSDAERELVRLFWGAGWAAIRAAGSGSSPFPSPDVLVSNAGKSRILAIECKVTAENRKTLSQEEVDQLKEFASAFGAEAWAAVKLGKDSWRFVSINELEEKGIRTISTKFADTNGFTFEELVE